MSRAIAAADLKISVREAQRLEADLESDADLSPALTAMAITAARQALASAEHYIVKAMRAEGRTWEEIGSAFQITRQAAQERWSK